MKTDLETAIAIALVSMFPPRPETSAKVEPSMEPIDVEPVRETSGYRPIPEAEPQSPPTPRWRLFILRYCIPSEEFAVSVLAGFGVGIVITLVGLAMALYAALCGIR